MTAFDYIQNRLGYRFLVTKSAFGISDKLEIELKLKNVGFGNMNKKKRAKLIFADESGEIKLVREVEDFTGSDSIEYSVAHDLENGSYDVYLRLYGEELEGTPLYCVQFANVGMWNAELKANKIGSFKV